ncbi:hypothetical protein D3C76_1255430 [compost metagenome]
MEVEIAFLLVVAAASLEGLIAFVGFKDPAQLIDFLDAHALGGQATGHAFEGFADFVELHQLGMVERHHPCSDVWHAHQQALAFEAVDGFAQRATADAVGTGQLGLGDFAARGDLTLDDGRLNASEDVFGKRFRVILNGKRGSQLIQHIVDTLKASAAKINQNCRHSQRIIRYCRQSSNNLLHHNKAVPSIHSRPPALAPSTCRARMPPAFVCDICTACHK